MQSISDCDWQLSSCVSLVCDADHDEQVHGISRCVDLSMRNLTYYISLKDLRFDFTFADHCYLLLLSISRVRILTRDGDIALLSAVRLSVRTSVRCVTAFNGKGLTYYYSFFTTRQPNHTSFMSITHFRKIPTGRTPSEFRESGGAKYRWGIKISRFLTNKSLYLQTIQDVVIVTTES